MTQHEARPQRTKGDLDMRRNRTITAMVSEREVEVIDRLVENGYYCSRSDAVRAFVRYCIARTERDGVIFE